MSYIRRSTSNNNSTPEEQQSFLSDSIGETLPFHSRPTQLSTNEVLHSLANRILHSSFYKWFYMAMALLSVVCSVLTFMQKCPHGLYYILEILVNLAMIIEVLIRVQALGKKFWRSAWNIADICLVGICMITLLWLAFGECSNERSWEAEADTILLLVRNLVQFSRVAVMVAKNGQYMTRRTQGVDFSTVPSNSGATGTGPGIFGDIGWNQNSFVEFEGEDDYI
ncbi:hypothetical protein HDU97_005901 [Phlyctochytrium planicorne]|nr:hypothetical protein HDU97_005901 [Phlyctochytrium planicorne]